MDVYRMLHKLVVFMPCINLFSLGAMILYVLITQGMMPSYNMPYPKQITFIYNYIVINIIYSIILITFLITKYPYRYRDALIFYVGLVLMILPLFNNNILDWITD